MNDTELILVAMSGGVDSSAVAALLAREGRKIVGVTMRVWEDPAGTEARHGACCTLDDANDARRVADKLGFPHYTLNVKDAFRRMVVDPFIADYRAGRTPNPCALCNSAIKFDHLFIQGEKIGATKITTGHYARIGEFHGRPALLRGVDPKKDQSYFLFGIPAHRLGSILFPLGDMTKDETRALAREVGLNVAEKKESQEICFIPDNDYAALVEKEGGAVGAGDIVTADGKVIGRHSGYLHYTVGQRKGLGIAAPQPFYVTRVEPDTNRVVVGGREAIMGRTLVARDFNWLVPKDEIEGLTFTARIRHNSPDAPADVTAEGERVVVTFHEPQNAIAPGQAVVVYHGDVVVGGGWIEERID
ncbi:MAG: tRNA 2-thiouridine(34) synthase MnmA [Nitrospinae bacterium]|nr:tRNA 2-thiouridine(34) synthase MnmA [Nitrospinota bacterium]